MLLLKVFFVAGIGVAVGNNILDTLEEEVSEVITEVKKTLTKPHHQSLKAFHNFMTVHNKTYSNREEYKRRYNIFRANMKIVEKLQV